MREVLVVGGRQREDAMSGEAWHFHERALAVRIDLERRDAEVALDYVSPPETCADDRPSICFSAGEVIGDRLYLCTKTEALVYDWPLGPDPKPRHHVSLPSFNDVHHVRPVDPDDPESDLWVVSTGLDLLVRCRLDGSIVELTNVEDPEGVRRKSPWHRFDEGTDYRKVATTKPHAAHPNFVFTHGGQRWVTRFEQKDAVCLDATETRIDLGEIGIHDGHVLGDDAYFTSVNGRVIRASLGSLEVTKIWDLGRIAGDLRKPGWCRGLALLDGGKRALVGFSRIRLTKWGKNVSWIKGGITALRAVRSRPARVALFDLERERLEWEFMLDGVDLSTVFSVHPVR